MLVFEIFPTFLFFLLFHKDYYHGDDFIIREGERGNTFYIINKGSVSPQQLIKKQKRCIVGEREMLWEHKLQAIVSTAFTSVSTDSKYRNRENMYLSQKIPRRNKENQLVYFDHRKFSLFSVFLSSYRNASESLRELEKLACGGNTHLRLITCFLFPK